MEAHKLYKHQPTLVYQKNIVQPNKQNCICSLIEHIFLNKSSNLVFFVWIFNNILTWNPNVNLNSNQSSLLMHLHLLLSIEIDLHSDREPFVVVMCAYRWAASDNRARLQRMWVCSRSWHSPFTCCVLLTLIHTNPHTTVSRSFVERARQSQGLDIPPHNPFRLCARVSVVVRTFTYVTLIGIYW